MEVVHAHRDHMRRDFHNKIDASRQRDSGLKGMLVGALGKDPTATAHKWRTEFSALPLPKSVKEMGAVGLGGFEVGTKLGKWVYDKTH